MTDSQLSTFNSPLVPPGYKQTEVGVLPKEWEVKPLKLISPRQSVGLVINPSTYFDKAGTVPLLVGSNISENAIESTTANRITKASSELLPASRLVAGDLVTVRVGEPGVTAVVPPELDGCNCASMMIVRQHPSFDSQWLCWMMNSQHGRRQVEHVQYGTAQKQFNISHAVDFLYPVPPLSEQRAIATALSDVDGLLGGLDRLIVKKRDLKQAAMQQLLTGQTRLPGFHGEWEVKSLSTICSMKSGEGITSANIDQFSKYPCYGGNGLRGYATRFTHDGSYALVGRQGALCGNVYGVEGQFFASEHAIVVTACEDTDIRWLTAVLARMNLNQYSESSAQPGLSVSKVLKLEIAATPMKSEQTAIAEVLADMDAELAGLEQRREKTRAIKQAMMQELLTGRIRLVESEKLKVESENSVKT
ncbi:MAG: restriction endonuclease subunit S [Nitrospira sp.]